MERVVELLKNSSYPLSTKTIARKLEMPKSCVTYFVTHNREIYKVKPIYAGSGKYSLSLWEYGDKNRQLHKEHVSKPTMMITPAI